MITPELEILNKNLDAATCPEDLFRNLGDSEKERYKNLKAIFYQFSRVAHPDNYTDDADRIAANEIFIKLSALRDAAELLIERGTYGIPRAPVTMTLSTKLHKYTVRELLYVGDIADIYACDVDNDLNSALFKLAKSPKDQDLMRNEAEILTKLYKIDSPPDKQFLPFIPKLIESFGYRDSVDPERQVNILSFSTSKDLYTFEDIHNVYKDGVNTKDMIWMFRRLLFILGYVHSRGMIHGAILPSHILVQPEDHGVILIDWCYASGDNTPIKAVSSPWKSWYPPEVFDKKSPSTALDIYMTARAVGYIITNKNGQPNEFCPMPLQNFLKSCLLTNPLQRPQDAFKLLEEFDELIAKLYGKRAFHPFTMPPK